MTYDQLEETIRHAVTQLQARDSSLFGRRAIERCLTAKFSGYLDSYLTTCGKAFAKGLRADPELASVLRHNPKMLALDTGKVLVRTSFKKFVFPQKADGVGKTMPYQPSELRFYRGVVPDTVVHDRTVERTANEVAIEAKMAGSDSKAIGQDILKLVGFIEQLKYRFGVFLELPRSSEGSVTVTTLRVVGDELEARFWTVPDSDSPPHLQRMSSLLVSLQDRQRLLEQRTAAQPFADLLWREGLLLSTRWSDMARLHQISLTAELVIALAQAPGRARLEMDTVLAQLDQSGDLAEMNMARTMRVVWEHWSGDDRARYLAVVARAAREVAMNTRSRRTVR